MSTHQIATKTDGRTVVGCAVLGTEFELVRNPLTAPVMYRWHVSVTDDEGTYLVFFADGFKAIETYDRWWNSFVTEGTRLWAWPGEER